MTSVDGPSAPHLLSKRLRRHKCAKLPSTRVNSVGTEVLSQTSRTSRRSGLANTKHIQILPRVFSCHYLPRKQLLELPQGDSVIMYRKGINQANSLFSCLPSTEKNLGTFDLEVRAQDWEVGAQAPLPALPKAHEHLKIIHVPFPVTWFPLCLKRAINSPSLCIKSELLLIITRGLRALDLN